MRVAAARSILTFRRLDRPTIGLECRLGGRECRRNSWQSGERHNDDGGSDGGTDVVTEVYEKVFVQMDKCQAQRRPGD